MQKSSLKRPLLQSEKTKEGWTTFTEQSTFLRINVSDRLLLLTVDIRSNTRHVEYPLSRIFFILNFFFGSFGTLGNCTYKFYVISNPTFSKFYYVKLFSWSLQRFLGLFTVRYIKHFHFTHSSIEKNTLIECTSFLISTQKHLGQAKA